MFANFPTVIWGGTLPVGIFENDKQEHPITHNYSLYIYGPIAYIVFAKVKVIGGRHALIKNN